MASLGAFGAPKAPIEAVEPDTFEWFGTAVRVIDYVNEVELIDLMEAARAIDAEDLAAIVVIKDGLRAIIDPEDFDTFWELAKTNRQGIEDLAEVMAELMSAMTGRPTQQPSDSSPGRLPTDANSPAVSTSPATHGRPDLELVRTEGAASQEWLRERIKAS